MNRNNKQVKQECSCCGHQFDLMYWANGSYTYLDDPCDCEAEFHPVEGSPTISEWLEQVTK